MYKEIKEIHKKWQEYLNTSLEVRGWVRSVRKNAEVAFIDLNDGTSFEGIQVIVNLENIDITEISTGSSISVNGILVESPAKGQNFEIKSDKIEVIGKSAEDYPLQKKGHTKEYLRTIAHLRPKTNLFLSVFRIRSIASFAIHQFFNERGFLYLHSPIITPSDAEGAGEMFTVTTNLAIDPKDDFFGKRSYLTVTGQHSAEAFAHAFKNVYTFGPTFRAENSNTKRHAAEFWMVEPEVSFCELDEVIKLSYDMLKYIIKYVLENAKDELEFLNKFSEEGLIEKLNSIVSSDYKKITYTEAIEILQKSGENFEYPPEWGNELQTEHEKYLAGKVYKGPVFVTDYPKDVKAFYMRLNDDGKTVAATDLLVPGIGELIGGSQREERFEILKEKMENMGLNPEDYLWYMELRKYGTVKKSGFGLGFERFIMYITGMENIRDVLPFPRTVNNLEF
ncbi:MAG: asparagine--tRNA ligase [Defluviitaleaceae bacterium]|nr:asparagine--tRNA ligase [Defluviitaleaceae bacterium]